MDQDIILKTDRAGRVRTPRERQEQIVAEWKTSGVSAMRFAEAIGVKYQTLAGWIRKHGGRADNGTAGETPRWHRVWGQGYGVSVHISNLATGSHI